MNSHFEYLEKYKYLSSACLNLTDDCNLMCRYCFVEQHPHYVSLETAKAAVDYLVKNLEWKIEHHHLPADGKVDLSLFGGEPTLMWDQIIVPLVEYAETIYPNKVTFNMTTNGTLLSKERIDYIYDHNIGVLLSIDGNKETQDINRPTRDGSSSFDRVCANIPYLLEKLPDTTFRATIYAPTVKNTFDNYIFAMAMGFKNIFLMPNCREKWSAEDKAELKHQVEKIYEFMANCFDKDIFPLNFSTINTAFEQILEHDIKAFNQETDAITDSRDCFRCGLGTGFGSIGYDGSIYGCQEQASKGKENKFYIGNIFEGGINEQLHKDLLEEYSQIKMMECENKELCKTCKLRNICFMKACPSTTYDLFNSFFIDSEIHCLWQQYLFDGAIAVMHFLTERNNKLFKEYLNTMCNFKQYFKEVEEE